MTFGQKSLMLCVPGCASMAVCRINVLLRLQSESCGNGGTTPVRSVDVTQSRSFLWWSSPLLRRRHSKILRCRQRGRVLTRRGTRVRPVLDGAGSVASEQPALSQKPTPKTRPLVATSSLNDSRAYQRCLQKARAPFRPAYCAARTWAGEQCKNLKHARSDVCGRHAKRCPHGRYNDAIAPGIFEKLILDAAKYDRAEVFEYYSRHLMWQYAAEYDVQCVEQLSDEDFESCLREVDKFYRRNAGRRSNDAVAKNAGPRSLDERSVLTRLNYCATGVREYMYYDASIFIKILQKSSLGGCHIAAHCDGATICGCVAQHEHVFAKQSFN